MQNIKKVLQELAENIIINNASKDLTEFFICENCLNLGKKIVLINQGTGAERLEKNFKFLKPDLRILFLEDASEIYTFKANSLVETGEQNKAINKILKGEFDVLCLDYKILLKKLPPRKFFEEIMEVRIYEKFGHSNLVKGLENFGFLRCDTVFDYGEFAVRGFIVDVGTLEGFFRIEFDGETISSITKFNTETQRKNLQERVEVLQIYKTKNIILKENWVEDLRKNAFNLGFEEVSGAINDISNFSGLGLEGFTPLFFSQIFNILDFLPQNIIFISRQNLFEMFEIFVKNLEDLYQLYKKEGKFFMPTNLILYDPKEIFEKLSPNVTLSEFHAQF